MVPAALISLLDADPDLSAALSPNQTTRAAPRLRVAATELGPGPWIPDTEEPDPAAIGLLILDGFVSATVEAAGRGALEVLGPGDLLRPWVRGDAGSLVASQMEWSVRAGGMRVAVLDGHAARLMAPWPELSSSLLHRATLRARRLALQAAINRHPRVTERLLLSLWSQADRWGHVTRAGVSLPLRLRHHEMAALVAAQRPSVSKAMSRLRATEQVHPTPGGWLLLGEPPEHYMLLRERSLLNDGAVAATH